MGIGAFAIKNRFFLVLAGLYTLAIYLCRNHIFFWDTIQLASKHAHWFYENQLKWKYLPENLDSGHIPAFGYYLATLWSIFGKSLQVSHFAMLPFGLGIIWQIINLIKKRIEGNDYHLAVLILLLEPVLITQMLLVSPDVWLVFFFLLGLNAIFDGKRILLSMAIIGLVITSQRGMMMAALLLPTQWLSNYIISKQLNSVANYLRIALPYIPGVLVMGLFFLSHLFHKGWIGYHSESPWASSFNIVNIRSFLRNQLILGWRLVDFGKIIVWIIFFFQCKHVINLWRQKMPEFILFSVFLILFLLVYTPILTLHSNLIGHRYLLPGTIALLFLTLIALQQQSIRRRKILQILILLALISGNFWKYPENISTGWDSTLGHLPYYSLHEKMISYISDKQIPFEVIGSEFPNKSAFKYLNLSCDTNRFATINLDKNMYILQSNVFNDISDSTVLTLSRDWNLEKHIHRLGIHFRLYKNPKYHE